MTRALVACAVTALVATADTAAAAERLLDEVAAVVGDTPLLWSDVQRDAVVWSRAAGRRADELSRAVHVLAAVYVRLVDAERARAGRSVEADAGAAARVRWSAAFADGAERAAFEREHGLSPDDGPRRLARRLAARAFLDDRRRLLERDAEGTNLLRFALRRLGEAAERAGVRRAYLVSSADEIAAVEVVIAP